MSAPLPGAQHTIPPYVLSARLSVHVTASLATVLTCCHFIRGGGTRLNESANHGLLLRLENTEVRTNFPAPQAAMPRGSATALRRHMLQHHATTGLGSCHG